jgi:fructokinase
MPLRIGIDLGGTKIEVVLLDDAGREQLRTRIATPREDYEGTIAAVVQLVEQARKLAGRTCSVGIGIPGAVSSETGLVKNANSTWIIGRALDRDLERALGQPVRVANDANCFALSEAIDGAAAGCQSVFGVILGTGVGGGLVFEGRVLVGVNGLGGEWGHNPLPCPLDDERPGPRCYCGRCGCIETWLSGPALAREAAADPDLRGLSALARARDGDARGVVELADCGHPAAVRVLDRYLDRLARSLASVINIVDPHAIVLGGGLSNIDLIYEELPRRWGPYLFSDTVRTQLLRNRHGDSSGVLGAARLWDLPQAAV